MAEKDGSFDILASDIGGTNCRFAHFTLSKPGRPDSLELVRTFRVRTQTASSFAHLLAMLREKWGPLSRFSCAGLGVAGPVLHARKVRLTNAPWEYVDLDAAPELPKRVLLLNDFEAQAWACLHPDCQNLLPVVPRSRETEERARCGAAQTIAVFGAGTGVGMSALLPGEPPRALASEGGHALFPFSASETQFEVFAHAHANPVTVERVLSGRGLSLLHSFHKGQDLSPAQVAAAMPATPVCEWFARFLGRACRNWTLSVMALNGLYIAGGIAASNPIILRHPAFLHAFYDSPEYGALLRTVPICLVRNTDAGLWGAGICAGFAAGLLRMS